MPNAILDFWLIGIIYIILLRNLWLSFLIDFFKSRSWLILNLMNLIQIKAVYDLLQLISWLIRELLDHISL